MASRAGASLPSQRQRRRKGRGTLSRGRGVQSQGKGDPFQPRSHNPSFTAPARVSLPMVPAGRGICCLRLRDATPGTSIRDTSLPASKGSSRVRAPPAQRQDKARPAQVSEQNAGQAVRHAGTHTHTPGTSSAMVTRRRRAVVPPSHPPACLGTHESTQAHPAEGRGARAYTVQVGSRCHRRTPSRRFEATLVLSLAPLPHGT